MHLLDPTRFLEGSDLGMSAHPGSEAEPAGTNLTQRARVERVSRVPRELLGAPCTMQHVPYLAAFAAAAAAAGAPTPGNKREKDPQPPAPTTRRAR